MIIQFKGFKKKQFALLWLKKDEEPTEKEQGIIQQLINENYKIVFMRSGKEPLYDCIEGLIRNNL